MFGRRLDGWINIIDFFALVIKKASKIRRKEENSIKQVWMIYSCKLIVCKNRHSCSFNKFIKKCLDKKTLDNSQTTKNYILPQIKNAEWVQISGERKTLRE